MMDVMECCNEMRRYAGPLDSFRYTPKLPLYSEDSCHLDTGYCRVRDGLATI
jgi:hypothetical protein